MILLDSVTKRYIGDEKPALNGVSLHIEPNEFVFLVGKSGAGKSTLIKMLTKEELPDSGKIIVGGIDLDYVKKRHIPGYRRRLGVVFQDFKLLPKRTVYENVAFALEIIGMSGKEIRKTVPKVLELVGLSAQAKKFPNQLSGGQRQRVGIARSVARQPKILIADEPTGQLDKLTTAEITDLLQKINDFGTTILVTTHNENIVNSLQKRVITLEDGKVISDQKNNGIYRLEEVPVETESLTAESGRVLRVPGYALTQTTTLKIEEKPAKQQMTNERLREISKEEKYEEGKNIKQAPEGQTEMKRATGKQPEMKQAVGKRPEMKQIVGGRSEIKQTLKKSVSINGKENLKEVKINVPRKKPTAMPNMTKSATVRKQKIAKSNVI